MEVAEFHVPEDKRDSECPVEVMRNASAVTTPQAEKTDPTLPCLVLNNISTYIFISSVFENLISKYLTFICNTLSSMQIVFMFVTELYFNCEVPE